MLRPSLGPQKFIWIFLLKELRRFTSLLSAPALPFWKRILSLVPFLDFRSLGRWPNEQCGGSVFRFSQMVVGKIGWRTTMFRLLRFFHMSYITLVPRQLLHPMLGLFSSSSLSCLPAANLLFPHQHLRKNWNTFLKLVFLTWQVLEMICASCFRLESWSHLERRWGPLSLLRIDCICPHTSGSAWSGRSPVIG